MASVDGRKYQGRGAMRFKLATAIGMGALLVAATVTPANAATNTIIIGASPTLTGRQLITVSITVVCDPLADTPFASGAWVSFRQTSGKQINTASGFTESFTGGPAAPMLTCDGVTQNTAVVQALPDQGSGPFHGGPALVSAFFFYQTAISCGPGCFQTTGNEGGSTPWLSTSFRG